ncbi:thermonuclease family protein [Altererythrobacter arenosus]|uniref:Thermonuclease family protein n=1 Tax=Altererythrobacter arenosus TaxID=3032592 RepID=A0ABY8FMA4_9SPHN|nr:thermonuclease family protein [Altererythrobacter sp. CAU 1644]WFL76152.1 thermonuclease family protein [Altererythrobacter sp. CAU 1644]
MIVAALALAICPPGPRDNCVVDGDTFWWSGEKVRIADIDAPEVNGKCEHERNLALESRDRLAELLGNEFSIHREGQDKYGRTLAIVKVSGRSVGAQLVREGLARTWNGRREAWC